MATSFAFKAQTLASTSSTPSFWHLKMQDIHDSIDTHCFTCATNNQSIQIKQNNTKATCYKDSNIIWQVFPAKYDTR